MEGLRNRTKRIVKILATVDSLTCDVYWIDAACAAALAPGALYIIVPHDASNRRLNTSGHIQVISCGTYFVIIFIYLYSCASEFEFSCCEETP